MMDRPCVAHYLCFIFSILNMLVFHWLLGAGCQCGSPYFCLVFVSFLSYCHHFVLLLSRFGLISVPILSSVPFLTLFCLLCSQFCPNLVQFLSLLVQYCPHFVLFWASPLWEIFRTNPSHNQDWIIFSFSTWSPCSWTKCGQYLDNCMSHICRLFVQAT